MNTHSCVLRRVACDAYESLWDLAEGEFFFRTDAQGQRWFNAMLPGQTLCCLPIRPLLDPTTNGGHSWEWDGNENAPTLTPSVHAPRSWHGWVRAGHAVSC